MAHLSIAEHAPFITEYPVLQQLETPGPELRQAFVPHPPLLVAQLLMGSQRPDTLYPAYPELHVQSFIPGRIYRQTEF